MGKKKLTPANHLGAQLKVVGSGLACGGKVCTVRATNKILCKWDLHNCVISAGMNCICRDASTTAGSQAGLPAD